MEEGKITGASACLQLGVRLIYKCGGGGIWKVSKWREREREPKIKRPTEEREQQTAEVRENKRERVLCASSQRTTVLLTR